MSETDDLFTFHRRTISDLRRDVGSYAHRLDLMESVACGWAFDAGMREAERDRALAQIERDGFVVFAAKVDWERSARDHDAARGQFLEAIRTCVPVSARAAAVAAERERCSVLARRAEELIFKVALGSEALRVLVRMRLDIESGAPAPREG